jgi:integrase
VLTARAIATLKPGPIRKEIPDSYLPGLYLVLQPSGAKSWAVRYRAQGRTRKHTLGSYPAIDLKSARELAARALRAVAEGRDPGQEKAQARIGTPNTVEALAKRFVDIHCRRNNRPNTIEAAERLLRLHVLPRWGKRLAKDIVRRDVIALLDEIVEGGRPITANRTWALVHKLFGWAVERDIVATSPCVGIKRPAPEAPRDRALSDSELSAVWLAAEKLGGPFGALIELLILTGARRDEVGRLSWDEIDLDVRLWRLPAARAKNKRALDIPLSAPAVKILVTLPRFEDGKFALTLDGGRTPSVNYFRGKERIDALLPPGFAPWRLHDLRRSVASGMARIGIALPTVEKVLGHVSGSFAGIVGGYQRHDFAGEKRLALEAWGRHVVALTAPAEPSNVVELARG